MVDFCQRVVNAELLEWGRIHGNWERRLNEGGKNRLYRKVVALFLYVASSWLKANLKNWQIG